MIAYRIIILILLPALLFMPDQDKGYLYLLGLISLTSLYLLPVFLRNFRQDISRKNSITIFFIFFLVASVVSTIFAIDQYKSVLRLLLYVDYFIVFTCIKSIFSTFNSKRIIALYFLLCTAALSLISLFNTLIFPYTNSREGGPSFMWIFFGHNHLSSILLFAIPLAFYFLWENWKKTFVRLILIFISGLLLFAMFFTFARASIFSLSIALVIGSFFLPMRGVKKSIVAFIIGIVSIIFVLLFRLQSITHSLPTNKVSIDISGQSDRFLYWNQALKNFTLHPLLGTGLDSFIKVNQSTLISQESIFLRTSFVHNFFLQMLTDAGIIGFLTSTLLILAVLQRSLRKIIAKSSTAFSEKYLSIAFFVGIFASTINTLVDFDWQIPTVFLIFWVIAGLADYE